MTHQNLRLGKCWKLFWATLRLFDFWISFHLSFFSFSLIFAAVIDLLLGLLSVKKESVINKGNFYHGAARCSGRKFWVFHSTFLAFLRISQAPLGWSLWCGHYWKDLFLLQKLSIDDAKFGQKWWCQKWKKGQGSSRAVTGSRELMRKWVDVLLAKKCSHNNEVTILTRWP